MQTAMNNIREVEEAASAWLARRDSGRWTAVDTAALETWLKAATTNRIAFLRQEAAWRSADRLSALSSTAAFHSLSPVSRESSRVRRGLLMLLASRRSRFAMAASVLIGICALMAWSAWVLDRDTYQTPIGGLEAFALPDGSHITLNTDTRLRVALSERERRIELQQGEALFDVQTDPVRPFVVIAGTSRVVVLGTRFSVRRTREGLRVVVTDGKVRVEQTDAPPSVAKVLSPGDVASTGEAGLMVQTRPIIEAEQFLSWRGGYLVFQETPLVIAIAEFNRYNARKLVLENPDLAALRIGGNFRATNVEAFVRLLEDGASLTAERRREEIVLR